MSDYVVHEEEIGGLTIKIIHDTDGGSMNPVEDWDMLGKQVYWHRNYNLGHEMPKCRPHEWFEAKLNREDLSTEDGWKEFSKTNLIIPVHAYEHGGITISTGRFSDIFDSGQLGFVYASHEDIKKNYNCKRITKGILEKAEKILKAEVDTYDDYLTGNIWGFTVEDENEDVIDSCWGYIGDWKDTGVLEDALRSAKYELEEREKQNKILDKRMMNEVV